MPPSALDVPARLWKPTSTARACARARLLDDVGQHAVARRQLQTLDDRAEQLFEPDDRLHVVARRVEPDDDVAAAVRQPFEDRRRESPPRRRRGCSAGCASRSDAASRCSTPSPGSGLKSFRATAESSSFVISLTTAAMASLESPAPKRRAHSAPPAPSRRLFSSPIVRLEISAVSLASSEARQRLAHAVSTSAARESSPSVSASNVPRAPTSARARRASRRRAGRLP